MFKSCFKFLGIVFILLLLSIPSGVSAGGVSPYLSLNTSPQIERMIERVMLLAGRPVMTRPIAVAEVVEALHDARERDEELCGQVETYLMRYMHDMGMTRLSAEVSVSTGDPDQTIPNEYGRDTDSSWEVSGEAYYRLGQYALISLGGIAYEGRATPTGSMLSLGMDYAQLDIGYRDHWFSPFTDSSMLIGTEAPTMPSVTLSNYRPITGLGLHYELFLAEMSESDRIAYQDRYTTGNPRLAGMHLEAEPVSGYAIGLNRQLQYGGGERNNDGIDDLIKAFTQPGKYDNTSSTLTSDEQFGNQQASLTARMMFPGRTPFSVYFEYAGEDTSRYKSYMISNTALSIGIDFPVLWDRFDLTYEATEWQNGWYNHGVYQDGLTNYGSVIGHWFGDLRQNGGNIGGDSHMLRLGRTMTNGAYVQAVYRTLDNDSYSSISYERMHEIALSYSRPWRGQTLGLELYSGRDVSGDWYAGLNASMDLCQDIQSASGGSGSIGADTDDDTDIFLDMGMNYGRSRIDRGGYNGKNFHDWSDYAESAHVGLGVRRTIGEHSDLGVRVEFDQVDGYDLFSARIFDYRYRVGKRFAMNGFLGVGRYNWGTPAYGWYMGMGPQLRDILPNWDLSVDGRFHMKLVRNKLLPSDPDKQASDLFNIVSVAVYLSRRW